MQFILSEEEYKKLIHSDRIQKPLDELVEGIKNLIKNGRPFHNPVYPTSSMMFECNGKDLVDLVQTFKIKVGL